MNCILIVLDGWGIAPASKTNAITRARTPYYDSLLKAYPHCTLSAHGKHVGLPPGYIGNSEVGHLHLGAGRPVKQDLARIFDAIKDGSFSKNRALTKALKNAKNSQLHLIGLVSDGGVHSHVDHLIALLKMAKQHKFKHVNVHAILDGRDTPPQSAKKYLRKVEKHLQKGWRIATIMGRYYAMDRDQRWQRTKKAYDAIVNNKGKQYDDWKDALQAAYNRGETDEFVTPSVLSQATVQDGDAAIFFNFRNDRAKQLTKAFVQKRFPHFTRDKKNVHFVCFTQYAQELNAPVAFPPHKLKNTLGEIVSRKGLRQLRLAETEKWAHVTFFFNGLTDKQFRKEDRKLIPSPKVSTYDKTPHMSAPKIAAKAVETIKKRQHAFILINFANADMVGHTGKLGKTIQAVQTIDSCLKQLVPEARKHGYDVIVTADHGNAEKMAYPDGSPCTAHTTSPVPCILVSDKKMKKHKNAGLYDIAPTVLSLLGIKQPKEMTGTSFTTSQ